jgi:hypothetical protein
MSALGNTDRVVGVAVLPDQKLSRFGQCHARDVSSFPAGSGHRPVVLKKAG